MAILSATNLSQAFGALDVFQGLSFTIPNDARIGLVGPNGVGKTSLLRVLAGLEEPTGGRTHVARGVRLGYLRQEAVQAFAGRDHTVWDEMLTVFASVRAAAERLAELEVALAGGSEALLAEYGTAQETFEQGGGYDYEVRIRQVLSGLGFDEALRATPLPHLSGGQKTRALLARLLLERPDLLILDEPTNHLDVAAVEWLEGTLRAWEGALLVVSHDRYFLDRVVDRIWEMQRSHLEPYRGNYSAYVRQRQERWERQEKVFEAEQERLFKELDFIRRHIAGQNTDIAMGKLKRLTRDLVTIETFGVGGAQGKSWSELEIGRMSTFGVGEAEARIRGLRGPTRPPRLNLNLHTTRRSGETVLTTKDLLVGYPERTLFQSDDLELERGARPALIGPNGAGKTTFLRVLLGKQPPLAGTLRLGANLTVGYFAQAHDTLNTERSVLDELLAQRPMTEGMARDHLAQFLFRGDDVYRRVGALSGGERGRLALAILALKGANFLLLDEPTNHLDIPAQEELQEALEAFPGTVLLVSHDRYLVEHLATEIWELRNGRLHCFRGRYESFLAARAAARQAARASVPASAPPPPSAATPSLSKNELRRHTEALTRVEQRIAAAEAALAETAAALQAASEAQDFPAIQRHSDHLTALHTQLDLLLTEWETLGEAVSA